MVRFVATGVIVRTWATYLSQWVTEGAPREAAGRQQPSIRQSVPMGASPQRKPPSATEVSLGLHTLVIDTS